MCLFDRLSIDFLGLKEYDGHYHELIMNNCCWPPPMQTLWYGTKQMIPVSVIAGFSVYSL